MASASQFQTLVARMSDDSFPSEQTTMANGAASNQFLMARSPTHLLAYRPLPNLRKAALNRELLSRL